MCEQWLYTINMYRGFLLSGIWSKVLIHSGQTFGPFEGERVQEAHSGMDPSYVWEVRFSHSKIENSSVRNLNPMGDIIIE